MTYEEARSHAEALAAHADAYPGIAAVAAYDGTTSVTNNDGAYYLHNGGPYARTVAIGRIASAWTTERPGKSVNRGWKAEKIQMKPADWEALTAIAAEVGSPNWRNLITRIARRELCVSTIKGE
jgi:hypothetical protein